jgi:hypothetical protein
LDWICPKCRLRGDDDDDDDDLKLMILHDCLKPMQKFLIYTGVDRQECMVGDASKQSICTIGCFAM